MSLLHVFGYPHRESFGRLSFRIAIGAWILIALGYLAYSALMSSSFFKELSTPERIQDDNLDHDAATSYLNDVYGRSSTSLLADTHLFLDVCIRRDEGYPKDIRKHNVTICPVDEIKCARNQGTWLADTNLGSGVMSCCVAHASSVTSLAEMLEEVGADADKRKIIQRNFGPFTSSEGDLAQACGRVNVGVYVQPDTLNSAIVYMSGPNVSRGESVATFLEPFGRCYNDALPESKRYEDVRFDLPSYIFTPEALKYVCYDLAYKGYYSHKYYDDYDGKPCKNAVKKMPARPNWLQLKDAITMNPDKFATEACVALCEHLGEHCLGYTIGKLPAVVNTTRIGAYSHSFLAETGGLRWRVCRGNGTDYNDVFYCSEATLLSCLVHVDRVMEASDFKEIVSVMNASSGASVFPPEFTVRDAWLQTVDVHHECELTHMTLVDCEGCCVTADCDQGWRYLVPGYRPDLYTHELPSCWKYDGNKAPANEDEGCPTVAVRGIPKCGTGHSGTDYSESDIPDKRLSWSKDPDIAIRKLDPPGVRHVASAMDAGKRYPRFFPQFFEPPTWVADTEFPLDRCFVRRKTSPPLALSIRWSTIDTSTMKNTVFPEEFSESWFYLQGRENILTEYQANSILHSYQWISLLTAPYPPFVRSDSVSLYMNSAVDHGDLPASDWKPALGLRFIYSKNMLHRTIYYVNEHMKLARLIGQLCTTIFVVFIVSMNSLFPFRALSEAPDGGASSTERRLARLEEKTHIPGEAPRRLHPFLSCGRDIEKEDEQEDESGRYFTSSDEEDDSSGS